MRDDLLASQAVIDWAVSQLQILDSEIDAWVKSRPYTITEQFDTDRRMDAFKVVVSDPPRLIDVHVGVIVHCFRSALDILAVTLARRNGVTSVENIYFPISKSFDVFNGDGRKKVKGLSAPDIAKIEALKPYKGGNDLLYALHHMDLRRKHTRLIEVGSQAHLNDFSGWGD
jgi:hypothetical protein